MLTAAKHTSRAEHHTSNVKTANVEPHRANKSNSAFAKEQNYLNQVDFNFAQLPIQAKLKINAPNDRYEQEADRIADKVVNMNQTVSVNENGNNTIHRKALADEISNIGNSVTQRKCSKCEEEENMIQRKTRNTSASVSGASIANQLNATRGSGSSMDAATNQYMSSRFGVDFSHVNIHNDAKAAKMSGSINASAFTLGRDIYFNNGEYNPHSNEGKRLLAHELVHTMQQNPRDIVRCRRRPRRINYNSAAPPPPTGPFPMPPSSSFAPLSTSLLAERNAHGLSTDSGPITEGVESALFPTGGSSGVSCVTPPANFAKTVATQLNSELKAQIKLKPTDASDPMAIAKVCADEAMPMIKSHYSPFAPSISSAAFMTNVSRKPTSYGKDIRKNDNMFAEFLEWFASENNKIYSLIYDKCGINTRWWERTLVPWLLSSTGLPFLTGTNRMRERAAMYDTYNTSTTSGGQITFGRSFEIYSIPHTVLHEALHYFTHPDFSKQIGRLQQVRSSTDIFTEGFTEYLARALTGQLVDAIQKTSPQPLTTTEALSAKNSDAYQRYFNKAVELRDLLYMHGQDGEEAIQRAYFLGEGWRLGLLEKASGTSSPLEKQNPVPGQVIISFAISSSSLSTSALKSLQPIVNYLKSRSISKIDIKGSTKNNLTNKGKALSKNRAIRVQYYLESKGISQSRISRDIVPAGTANSESAILEISDSRNLTP